MSRGRFFVHSFGSRPMMPGVSLMLGSSPVDDLAAGRRIAMNANQAEKPLLVDIERWELLAELLGPGPDASSPVGYAGSRLARIAARLTVSGRRAHQTCRKYKGGSADDAPAPACTRPNLVDRQSLFDQHSGSGHGLSAGRVTDSEQQKSLAPAKGGTVWLAVQ